MPGQPYRYKLFDLYTQKYILTDPQDPQSVLTEDVENSLLEFILPESAKERLSVATIEMGMDEGMVANNHPEPDKNVLLLAKGSRGIYGPAEYKELLQPYLDLVKDYPYQRYLTNENVSVHTKDLKIWVVDDERGISGVEGISSEIAAQILGDSHGKMSLELATAIGSPLNLMQYRMISADTANGWFAKGTLAPSLNNTLEKFALSDRSEFEGVDLIVPTSSLKGVSRQNLPPGIHTSKVHLSHHNKSRETKITLRSVLEKLDGDSFTSALKQQAVAIAELNEIFANSDRLNQKFMKSLEPVFMPNPDNPDERIDFDPDRWEQCGDWKYITYRKDYESGHQQLINSPIFAQDKEKFYASRARKAAQLSFVKANGGMIFCSSQLTNNQICVPGLPDGAKVAAIRSPIIKLQDIALVENKLIDDINNDAGMLLKGAIICSPQAYKQLLYQTRSFISQNTDKLAAAGIDTQAINRLNPFNSNDYKDVVLAEAVGEQREELTLRLNLWREGYNALINNNQSELPHLEQIRQDSFTAIIKGDFDGDNIAILPQQQYPAIYAGIEARINGSDSYTAKLDKIEVTGEQELSWLLADKADPYILGKTANLTENLQSLAVAADRVQRSGTIEQQLAHIKQLAPSFYYMMANPTAAEIKAAEAANLPSTFRYYNIFSTRERLIDEALVQQFDAYGLDKALLQVYGGDEVEPIVAQRLFDTWKGLLLNLTDAVAQQNQIAVDTFKSERPIDRDLVEGIAGRFRILDDGLKKALSDNETYLSQVPQVKDSVTNRSLLVQNVNQNLVAYQAPFSSYKQIQGLFPNVEDEFINQEVASLSNEYDKLTSLSSTIRQKSRIDRGPSMIFNDSSGRSFEVTNIMAADHSVASLSKEFTQGNVKIKFEPNTKADSPHQLVALYSVGQDWQSLGTVCNACVKRLDLDLLAELELDNISDIDFTSSSAVHLADSYSQRAYRLAWEFRTRISDEQVNDYAAATYNYLTNSTSQSNRLGLMFQIFGSELATQVESMQFQEIKVGSLTNGHAQAYAERYPLGPSFHGGVRVTGSEIANSMQIQIAVNEAGQPVVMRVNEVGELTELGIISPDSFQLRPGARAMVQAEYLAPSVADITLPDGEQLTVGGMSKFETAGTVFRDEELELETAMGSSSKTPVIKIDGEIVGNLKQENVAYLEDNQLLVEGQALDLTLTTVGKGYYQKIKAVAPNGKTLELTNLSKSFQQPVLDKQVSAQVSFKTNRPQMQLYAYRQGKRVAIGEFNYGNQGSHRKSLDKLKAIGLDRQIFKGKVNSRLSVLTLKIDPESISYQDDPALVKLETAKIEVKEVNPTTDYFLARQQQYQNFGVIRLRDYLNDAGEIESALSLDLVVDESFAQYIADDAPRFRDSSQISDGDPSIELETVKGFTVYSKPIEAMKMVEIAQLKQEFNLQEIYDLSAPSNLNAAVAYQTQLKNNYPDVVEFEAQPSGSERLFLPSIYSQAGGKGLMTTVSSKLLEVINFTPTEPQVNQIKLDRFDYLWLQQNLKLDPGLSDQQILQAAFRSENHIQLRQLTSGIITAEGELVYQHVQAATDARFGEELKSVLGQPNYEFHRENAKRLIDLGITPVVVYADGNTSIASKLLVNRPEVTIPLPEKLDRNIAPPIVIGGADKFGLSLNNPHDYQNPDLEHPVSYEGINYPSVQHAYSEIVNRDNIPQSKTYGLVKELMFAKLSQHPQIVDGIRSRGGYKWLYTCSHQLEGNEFWTGQGKDTPLVGIIAAGMKQTQLTGAKSQENFPKKIITLKSGQPFSALKRQISTPAVEVQPTDPLVNNKEAKSNPLANIQPKNAAVASHMVKDLAMADVATQFIGMPVNFDGKSSTEKYLQAWGERANTGSYTANDVVIISGNGPWRTTPERLAEVFDNQYRPLIDKAIAAKAKIVVGSAKGTDLLVQQYLESQGYKLADSGRNYVEATSATLPRAASIQSPALNIVGKKVSMSYPLMLEGRSNPLSVNTCFDAMRGHGRIHTTRNFEPYKAWGFKEGDLAIAYDNKTNREILFRVGKQQRITNQMIADPNYQAQWAEVEKHAPEVLPKLFASKVAAGNEVWGMTYEPLGDFVNGKIYDFEDGKEIVLNASLTEIVDNRPPQANLLPNQATMPGGIRRPKVGESTELIAKSIQQIGVLDKPTQTALLEHLEGMKQELNTDVSQYAACRQNFWLGTQWNLKDKQFESSGTWNARLWEFCKRIYPDADMALITYSGDEQSAGINLHRDDSYADFEARTISLETVEGQESQWQMKQAYPGMGWVKEQNAQAELVNFSIPSGSMMAFNCKNPHAATPGVGRWSINLWSVAAKQKEAYAAHLATHGIDGGSSDLGKDKTVIPLPEPINLTAESRAKLSSPPIAGIQSQAVPVVKPAPSAKNNIVAMINVPNLDGVNSAKLKSQVSETLINSNTSAKLLDTIKVWRNQLGEINNVNSLIANFADSPDLDTLKYRAALVGQSTSQLAVVAFREDINGSDALYSVNVPNHVDEYALRAKLSELEITQFSIIPTPKFNKVIISDRAGEKLSVASEMAKHYESKLTITQGQSIFIREREYAQTIGDFAPPNSAISRRGDRDRSDQSRGESQSDNLGGDGGGVNLKPAVIQPTIAKSIATKIVSLAQIQHNLTLEAVPILREILNNSPGKRKFTDGEIVISYQSETKTLSVVDLASSQLKMQAIYDGQKWQSDPKCLGGMRREDLAFLKAALVMVKAQSSQQNTSTVPEPAASNTRSYFASLTSPDPANDRSNQQGSAIER